MSQLTLAPAVPRVSRAPAPRRARLQVVDARPPVHTGTAYGVLCLGLVLAGLLALLLLNTTRAESSYLLSDLRVEATALHDERVTLQAELDGLRSPESLARQADALGLVPSPSTAQLRLSDGQVLGVAAGVDPQDSFSVVRHASDYDEVTSLERARSGLQGLAVEEG